LLERCFYLKQDKHVFECRMERKREDAEYKKCKQREQTYDHGIQGVYRIHIETLAVVSVDDTCWRKRVKALPLLSKGGKQHIVGTLANRGFTEKKT